jgi:hypothetical protein
MTEGGRWGKSDIWLQGGVIGGIDAAGMPNSGEVKVRSRLSDSIRFGANRIEQGRRPFSKGGRGKEPLQWSFKGSGCCPA